MTTLSTRVQALEEQMAKHRKQAALYKVCPKGAVSLGVTAACLHILFFFLQSLQSGTLCVILSVSPSSFPVI